MSVQSDLEASRLAKSNIIEATTELVSDREKKGKKKQQGGMFQWERHPALTISVIYTFLEGRQSSELRQWIQYSD